MMLYLWDGKLGIRDGKLWTSADCCCGGGGACTKRTGNWQIVVEGVTGSGCDGSSEGSRCPDVNGTYTFTGPPDVTTKVYANTQDKNICGLYDWQLRFGYDANGDQSIDECDYLLDHGGLDDVAYYGNGLPNETITLSLVTSTDALCQNYPATIDLVPV